MSGLALVCQDHDGLGFGVAPCPRCAIDCGENGIAQAVAGGERLHDHPCLAAWHAFTQVGFRGRLSQLVVQFRREADAITLRGLLALEAGDTEGAARDFRRALATWGGREAVIDGSGIDFNGRILCQGALAWIESVHPDTAR